MSAPAPNLETAAPSIAARTRGFWNDFSQLTKARLTLLVLLTTLAGFYLGSDGPLDGARLLHTLLGTALTAAASAALNQFIERRADAQMRRTKNRPLAAERVPADEVVVLAVSAAVIGEIYLALMVNVAAAALALASLLLYLLVYTPMKMRSEWNTIVGAIPGAIPPLIGWAGAGAPMGVVALALFGILFFWQMPHFYAIAWLYRDDYASAGFQMLPLHDPEGARTGRHSLYYALPLAPLGIAPYFTQWNTVWYGIGAIVLGVGFVWLAWRFAWQPERGTARALFLGSIIYLPVQLALMAAAKAWA
jgi:protoheme IX farnesyltransferase